MNKNREVIVGDSVEVDYASEFEGATAWVPL